MPEAWIKVLTDLWSQLVALVVFVLWLSRLEWRANSNTRDLTRLEERLAAQRQEDIESRRRDWDKMEAVLTEMRQDIKTLLQQRG